MFTYACLIIAVLLAAFSVKKYRIAAYVVAFEFAAHKIVFELAYRELGLLDFWEVYLWYGIAQFVVLSVLRVVQCHFFIMALIAVNMFLNFYMAIIGQISTISMIYYNKFMSIYATYPYFVNTIMVLELAYLGWLHDYVSRSMRNRGLVGYSFIDRLLCATCPSLSKGALR